MSVTLVAKNGITCPAVVCDVCGQEIKDARSALAVWEWGKPSQFRIVHKNGGGFDCDADHLPMSMELDAFFFYLFNNIGLQKKSVWKEAGTKAMALSSLR